MIPASMSEEYHAVRRQAGLIDCSSWGLLEIRGADRVTFLHGLLTNDIKGLPVGGGCQAALVNAQAKLIADLLVLADTEAHWLIVPRSRAAAVLQSLNRYLITEDVRLTDRTQACVLLAIQGPASASVVHDAFGVALAEQPLTHQVVEVDGIAVRLVAHSLTGEPGGILVVAAEHAAWARQHLLERGHAQGLHPVGGEALNILRIEAGIPWYGIDMDEANLLPETGLESRAVSYTKGCYVGQEVIARLETYGSVNRKLLGLVFNGEMIPAPKDAITKDGEWLGEITSACFSPKLAKPIALGYVKRPFYEAEVDVAVNHGGKTLAARMVKLPFIKKEPLRSHPA